MLNSNLDEMAASPHGAVEMYMCRVTSFFSFNLRPFRLEGIASNKLSAAPESCDNKFRYKNLKSKTILLQYYYRLPKKLREGNVFTGVCLFTRERRVDILTHSPRHGTWDTHPRPSFN